MMLWTRKRSVGLCTLMLWTGKGSVECVNCDAVE